MGQGSCNKLNSLGQQRGTVPAMQIVSLDVYFPSGHLEKLPERQLVTSNCRERKIALSNFVKKMGKYVFACRRQFKTRGPE